MPPIDMQALVKYADTPLAVHALKRITDAASRVNADITKYDVTVRPFVGTEASQADIIEVEEFINKLSDFGLFTIKHFGPSLDSWRAPTGHSSLHSEFTLSDIDSKLYRVAAIIQSRQKTIEPTANISLLDNQIMINDAPPIKLGENTTQLNLLQIVLKHADPHRKWSWDELVEEMGENPDDTKWRNKIYKAGYDLNNKCKIAGPPLFIRSTQTIQLNPEYKVT